jgi:hypothetical protein
MQSPNQILKGTPEDFSQGIEVDVNLLWTLQSSQKEGITGQAWIRGGGGARGTVPLICKKIFEIDREIYKLEKNLKLTEF